MDVDVTGSQGVQVGNHNLMYNVWLVGQRLDAASLADVGPHQAGDMIRAMAYNDAVLLLAGAEVDAAVVVLGMLLKTDEALAVSLLADISQDKAGKLIAAVTADAPGREWLRQLPEAAKAISDRSVELKWTGGRLERAQYNRLISSSGSLLRIKKQKRIFQSYCSIYETGRIYWSKEGGTRAVTGAILDYYVSCGGQLGIPTGEETPIPSSVGRYWIQRFSSGAIYRHESSVIPVQQRMVDYLDAHGGADQFYPLTENAAAATSPSPYRTHGWLQRFRGSGNKSNETVYDAGTAYGVSGEIESFYDRLGGTSSWLGYPISDATLLGSHFTQDFEGGTVFTGISAAGVVAVPAVTMRLIQHESIRERLGFPVAAEEPAGSGADRWQFFENGVVTFRNGKLDVWVRPDKERTSDPNRRRPADAAAPPGRETG